MTASCIIKIVEIPAGYAGSFAEAIAPYTTLKKSERTRLVSAGEPFELKLDDEAAAEELRKLCTTYGVQIESSRTLLDEDDWSGDDKAIEAAETLTATATEACSACGELVEHRDDCAAVAEAVARLEAVAAKENAARVEEPAKKTRKARAKKVETEAAPAPSLAERALAWCESLQSVAVGAVDSAERTKVLLEAFEAETDPVFVEAIVANAGPFLVGLKAAGEDRLKALLQAELAKGDAPPEVEVIAERQEHSFERELTDDDWRELGKTSAQAARRAADLKAELDRTSKRLKGAIEVAVGEAVDAQNAMLAGKRTITVEVRAELRTDGMVHLVRLDTGEVVERRPLTEQERQRSLFSQAAKTNGVETPDADDDGWADKA